MKGLTDIPGIRVGHVSDFENVTGCTAVLCEQGAVCGADLRGSATGTQEIDTLRPGHVTDRVHGILLSGGSAFGLEAASGVRRYLASRKVGFEFGGHYVPIVPAAILFDLGMGKGSAHPGLAMGEAAAAASTDGPVAEGSVGAGTGATVGKFFGRPRAMKGGIGTYTLTMPGGVIVSALCAVNALGDIRDPATGKIVAGARKSAESREFVDAEREMLNGVAIGGGKSNTTLAIVATNVALDKVQATKLAQFASIGMARTIAPVNTMLDGDTVFALSIGTAKADINNVGVAAAHALGQAILRGVRMAKGLAGVPGLAG